MGQILLLLVGSFLILSAGCESTDEPVVLGIIPKPAELIAGEGTYILDKNTVIRYDQANHEIERIAGMFILDLKKCTGIGINGSSGKLSNKIIKLEVSPIAGLPEEGYLMTVRSGKITINGSSPQGVFYGLQTLRQIVLTSWTEGPQVTIPAFVIKDYPRFGWRGMMLDTGRHYFTVDLLKRFIDHLALYKLNRFHWHLTEDQGWRIEILKYPLLTEIGAGRKETLLGNSRDMPRVFDGIPYDGFYTQEEVREIVRYASDRYITVIPEIEMPGHSQAAIAAYPELGVTGDQVEVRTEWGVSPIIFKPSEQTFLFLEDVLTEVLDLFPSEYIHIGGDEAIKKQWKESAEVQDQIKKLELSDEEELQSWFIKRIEQFLNNRGRKLIGWDEILQGGLAPNATVISWRGIKRGIEAAQLGHDVIMAPNSHLYFSYYQADPATEPIASRNGLTRIDKVYSYDPVPAELSPEESKHILGIQACLWTEYMKSFKKVEYMMFPRICALSELAWTSASGKDFSEFSLRLQQQVSMFRTLGINYSRSGMPEMAE
ncbi:MAG: beta-N-acetylhexosaminidase [Bacteroidales bacterium]